MRRRMLSLLLIAMLAAGPDALYASDVFIKDTPADDGTQPNPDTGPMWVSEDIWVRTTNDPAYQPYPFDTTMPLPWIPQPNEPAEYRDPRYGKPNYVYVRVRNGGTTPSSGTEELHVYWAKASTGLAWPASWVDSLDNDCGPQKLYGAEITKPRRNAALASKPERDAYVQAILDIGTLPAFTGSDFHWKKQNEIHLKGPNARHGTPYFLPWHREFLNRYEALLQEANPTVKLLYWDWTKDPAGSGGGFNFFTPDFMGASGRGTGGTSIGAPFLPALAPPSITRNLSTNTTPPADSDATLTAPAGYIAFEDKVERFPNHNTAHGYIGGGGTIHSASTAAQDPFFFLLHGNVDRLWAMWQRNVTQLGRVDRAFAYGGAPGMTVGLAPWNASTAAGQGMPVAPWSTGSYVYDKPADDPSVVFPPIYDDVPLRIPVLQPNEAVVFEIPWYPPYPADFSCFGGDQGHFCLLARIVPGMAFAETSDLNGNVRNNNNIAWKNITVVDKFPGLLKAGSVIVRNVFRERVQANLRLADPQEIGASFREFGRIFVDLKPALFNRWVQGGARGRGIRVIGAETLRADQQGSAPPIEVIASDASIDNIRLEPEEAYSIDVSFQLPRNYPSPRGVVPRFDLMQTGAPGNPEHVIGGQRFDVDFNALVPVPAGARWRYLDDGSFPGPNWMFPSFDDSRWKSGQAELGFGEGTAATTIARHPTVFFRHAFDVSDAPAFRTLTLRLKRDDGAVVYLNGTEIHRVNLPAGSPIGAAATRTVDGLEEDTFFNVAVDPARVVNGRNVIAVELHQDTFASEDATFDLELAANRSFPRFDPGVAFAFPLRGSVWQVGQGVPISIEAFDGDTRVASVSFFADGQLVGTDATAPYSFTWIATGIGRHRLAAIATDDDAQRGLAEMTVSVVANAPPLVEITHPPDGTAFREGTRISATALAIDVDKVDRVEFYVRKHERFDDPDVLAGRITSAPYTVLLPALAPGHYVLSARVVDNRGASNVAVPVHFTVQHEHTFPKRRVVRH